VESTPRWVRLNPHFALDPLRVQLHLWPTLNGKARITPAVKVAAAETVSTARKLLFDKMCSHATNANNAVAIDLLHNASPEQNQD